MVEVALLLLSRGLPSSHRQLRWTHTKVFAIAGLNNVTSDMWKHQQQFWLIFIIWLLVVNFNFTFPNWHLYGAGPAMNSLPSLLLNIVRNIVTTQNIEN